MNVALATGLMAKRPRFAKHFTSTDASWLNMIEQFFCDSVTSVVEFELVIDLYVADHNIDLKPFSGLQAPPTSWPRTRGPRLPKPGSPISTEQGGTSH